MIQELDCSGTFELNRGTQFLHGDVASNEVTQ